MPPKPRLRLSEPPPQTSTTVQIPLQKPESSDDFVELADTVKLPEVWEALGPFAHGSRELGVDPLSAYGGFEDLPYSDNDCYPSELADGGFVQWRHINTNSDQTVGPISYPNVRWEFNQGPFGWASLHHATYLRGKFHVSRTGVYLVSFWGVISFKIDDRALAGNVYQYTHESSSAIVLTEGEHFIYVCSVMDVRLNGGSIPPKTQFGGTFTYVEINTAEDSVLAIKGDAIMPEVMGGTLVTPFASVTLLNANVTAQHVVPDIKPEVGKLQGGSEDEAGWVQVVRVRASCPEGTEISVTLPVHFSVKLAPGQIYPVPLNISVAGDKTPSALKIEFDLADLGSTHQWTMTVGDFPLTQRVWGNVYKMTFQDYDHSIHYAMVRPPKRTCTTFPEKKCPVMLTLHGAGVEAASTYWTDAYKQQEYAWLLYPTGRTPWGYDWHGPSYHNVIAALDALHLLPGVPSDLESEMGVNRQRLIYTGHSNGGQGAWWMLSHYPDIAIAGLPAAGYMKIQFYIPFYMRVGDAYADPVLRGILESSIAENDIDLYAANMAGVPILPRTGGADDNVPPFHTRRLARLVNEWNRNPSSTNISEIPHQGHWFAGVVDDDVMQSFIDTHVAESAASGLGLPPLPEAFTLSSLNPASTGSKGGVRILQLQIPFRLGTIRVHRRGDHWILNTTNVRRFGFTADPRRHDLARWSVDGTDFDSPPSESGKSYLRNEDGTWKLSNDLIWISEERHFSTYGPAVHVFDSPFIIVIPSTHSPRTPTYRQIAQHLVTSWYLYGRGATQIVRDIDVLDGVAAQYNMVVLGGPEDNMFTQKREKGLPVSFLPSGGFQIDTHQYAQPGTGILFLAPSPTRTRMGLFVAGTDIDGLLRAAWTIPFRTGLQVPDYIVVGDEYGDPATGWTARDGAPFGGAGTKGAGGVFAAGYWSNTWDFDARCGYLK